MTQQTGVGINHYQRDAYRGMCCIQQGRVGSLIVMYTTDREVGMGHCQGYVYNRQRGRHGPLLVMHTTDRGVGILIHLGKMIHIHTPT